jgi:hypothetical protein
MKRLLKDNPVQVLLSDEEDRALAKAVEIEAKRRKDVRFGKGTLLRELAMPRVLELIGAEQDAA